MRQLLFLLVIALPLHAGADGVHAAGKAGSKLPACPSQDFKAFVHVFAVDIAVQRAYTNDGLITVHLEEAEPEPASVTRKLRHADVSFPVVPAKAVIERDGLQSSISLPAPGRAVWRLAKPDSDYQIDYHFRKQGCWKLERIVNDSL